MEDLGIYTNIQDTGRKAYDGRHKLYSAKCKICGRTVERVLYDLRHYNSKCQHGKREFDLGGAKMPEGFFLDKYNERVYQLWRQMMFRGTEKFWKKYPTYTGTTIASEWQIFENFYKDIIELPGYELWRDNPKKRIMLDKDILGHGAKLYSKCTCCFVTPAESNKELRQRYPENMKKFVQGGIKSGKEHSRKVKATNEKTGEVRYFDSIKKCAYELNDLSSSIWMCLSKAEKYNSHKSSKGWIFEEIIKEI